MRPTFPEGEAITAEHLNAYCTRWVTPTLSRDGECADPSCEQCGRDSERHDRILRILHPLPALSMDREWDGLENDRTLPTPRELRASDEKCVEGPIQAGCSTDPTQPAEDMRNETRAAAWRDAAAASTGARADAVDDHEG
eukprot:3231845-Rhodomonas_salina.1